MNGRWRKRLLVPGLAAALAWGCTLAPEARAYRWLQAQQGDLALLGNQEDDDLASVYTNALAAICFTHRGDTERARRIFEQYQAQAARPFAGFHQFSSRRTGQPLTDTDHWVGDNAWLLIALNFYAQHAGDTSFDDLRHDLSAWIINLQDDTGGVRSGFRKGEPMDWIVTEAMLDCYAALIHQPAARAQVLHWLTHYAWNRDESRFKMGSTSDETALDNVSWGVAALGPAYRTLIHYAEGHFLRTDTSVASGVTVEGFTDFTDRRRVWFEGTGQMALAYRVIGAEARATHFLEQMERALIDSAAFPGTRGLPCMSSDPPWEGADRKIFVPSVAWYLLAKWHVNPMRIEEGGG